jgi:uncharacterized protein YndB with AHSA1/START domain
MPAAPRITLLTRVALPIETVFELWTLPAHIQRWWGGSRGQVLHASVDARLGGMFWVAVALPGEQGYDNFGKFTGVHRGEALTVDWDHGRGRVSQLVVQLLAQKDGLTEVTLTHREFPDERMRDFQLERWQDALAAFDAYAAEFRP